MLPVLESILIDRSNEARLWVIPLEGTHENMQTLLSDVQIFLEEWTSHGRSIQSSAALYSNRFLLIAGEIPGGTISGCGIDNLINSVEKISENHHCRILPAMFIYYRTEHGEIAFASRSHFRTMVANKEVSAETNVFNPGIYTLNALRAGEFERPLSSSIYARIIRIPTTA